MYSNIFALKKYFPLISYYYSIFIWPNKDKIKKNENKTHAIL